MGPATHSSALAVCFFTSVIVFVPFVPLISFNLKVSAMYLLSLKSFIIFLSA